MTDPYEEQARSTRAPYLQRFLDELGTRMEITPEFRAASEHPYNCRCPKCLDWWATIGPDGKPDDENAFGPFTREEVESYCEANGRKVLW